MAKRRRATIVAIRDGKVLLVRDRGKRRFSLPGGGVRKGEPSLSAAIRELYEETGLTCSEVAEIFDYKGTINYHRVFRATPKGNAVRLRDGELAEYTWWDGRQNIRADKHVKDILARHGWPSREGG